MHKVLSFPKPDDIVSFCEKLLDMAKAGEFDKIAVIANSSKDKDDIMTGYYNLSVIEKAYYASHIQSDVTLGIVQANIDQLIEYINN